MMPENKNAPKRLDVSDIFKYDDAHRMRYNSPVENEADIAFSKKTVGLQWLGDKLQRARGYSVSKIVFNPEDRSFDFFTCSEKGKNGSIHYTYEQICDVMRWHSFEVVDPEHVLPTPFTYEEIKQELAGHEVVPEPEEPASAK